MGVAVLLKYFLRCGVSARLGPFGLGVNLEMLEKYLTHLPRRTYIETPACKGVAALFHLVDTRRELHR